MCRSDRFSRLRILVPVLIAAVLLGLGGLSAGFSVWPATVAQAEAIHPFLPPARPPDPPLPDAGDEPKVPDAPAEASRLLGAQSPEAWAAWDSLPTAVQNKVDERILAELRGEAIPAHLASKGYDERLVDPRHLPPVRQTRFLVFLKEQPKLTVLQDQAFESPTARRQAVFQSLRQTALASQAPLRAVLDRQMSQGLVRTYQSFFIVNALAVEGDLQAVTELAQRPDVERILPNVPLVPIWDGQGDPQGDPGTLGAQSHSGPNWNIERVRADQVWEDLGVRGEGAVVGGFDTGVDYLHPALRDRYRGVLPDGSFDHNYSWFEPDPELYPDGNLGPSVSAVPYDCNGHGTHTMGTMVGDGGTPDTRIGMAPGARWVAVSGLCSNTAPGGIQDSIGMLKAFQWFLCPTDLTGDLATADCSKAPDVINNSWGSANPADQTFRPVIRALRAAGIAPVFAAGNPSAGPGSIGSPASVPEAIAVGAVDYLDTVAYFSGRGPSFYPGEQKPEFTAPGVSVLSSIGSSDYDSFSGTSMAAPHVAGLAALMLSADRRDGYQDLSVDEVEALMASTAVDLGKPGPDDDYGYGRIDAFRAVDWVLSAGDIQGRVRDEVDDAPLDGAQVFGQRQGSDDRFTGITDATGLYSLTVPGGLYEVTVAAWGHVSRTFPSQVVLSGTLTLMDFTLPRLPTASIQGTVQASGQPVAQARVFVSARPQVSVTTGADGSFVLTLPRGRHQLTVEASGYRTAQAEVEVTEAGGSVDFALVPAPSILLVDPTAQNGWFDGWPVTSFFQQALDQRGLRYDLWRIEYTDFNDTQTLPDGRTGHGIPSLATLQGYDVVIWASSACGRWREGCSTPGELGADDELSAYLAGGGRLLLSGQDLVQEDREEGYLAQQLQVGLDVKDGASTGDGIQGKAFLTGLTLTVTNASLYGYSNGWYDLDPDALLPLPGENAVFPILAYEEGGNAALAVNACQGTPFRAVVLGVGYENVAPRGQIRDPAMFDLLDRAVTWLAASNTSGSVEILPPMLEQSAEPGERAVYRFLLVNTGNSPKNVQVSLQAGDWPVQVQMDGRPVAGDVALPPCSSVSVQVLVDVPGRVSLGKTDHTLVSFTPTSSPEQPFELVTKASPRWRAKDPLPTGRYRLGAASLLGVDRYYAVGGLQDFFAAGRDLATDAVERYDACLEKWSSLPPLPEPAGNLAVVALNGQIYALGGMGFDLVEEEISWKEAVYRFDPATASWTAVAPLPSPRVLMAGAAAQGKIYLFGGIDQNENELDQTLEYDPATDSWQTRAPMPGGPRSAVQAATLDGKIYVVGGWPYLDRVEVYDPATDSWSTAAPLLRGRQSPALAPGADGFLYVAGGGRRWSGVRTAERYNPATDSWEPLSDLPDRRRVAPAGAFTGGQFFVAGGGDASQAHDGLRAIFATFCRSWAWTNQKALTPGGRITYTVEIFPNYTALAQVHVQAPLPAGTRFLGFVENSVGATFDATANQVTWTGQSQPGDPIRTFSYQLQLQEEGWHSGDLFTHTVHFQSSSGLAFTRTVLSRVYVPDFSPSTLSADRTLAASGDVLTYTVDLRNATPVGGDVAVLVDLPPALGFVTGSLTATVGTGSYDPEQHTVFWFGLLEPGPTTLVNPTDDYLWGDSDGAGDLANVEFDWTEISGSGQAVASGDESYVCGLPVGFDFQLYGESYTEFCVSTNGFLSFDESGWSDYGNDCPLPSGNSPGALVAAVWDDLVIEGAVYYQTLGVAPDRRLVVEWSGARRYGRPGSVLSTFQLILWENGLVDVQILEAGALTGSSSTTGLEDMGETQGVTYRCNASNSLHDNLAVKFIPPNSVVGTPAATVSYAAQVKAGVAANMPVTTTAYILDDQDRYTRTATVLVNPIDLSQSQMEAAQSQVTPGQEVGYSLVLRNQGLVTATASLSNTLPQGMSYVAGSLNCTVGACQEDAGRVRWEGALAGSQAITVSYRARLDAMPRHGTPIVNTALVDDGIGHRYPLTAVVQVNRSDLSSSFLRVEPARVDPGAVVTVTIFVRNGGGQPTTGELRHRIPDGLVYQDGSLFCGVGLCAHQAGEVTWSGSLVPRGMVPVRFQVQVPQDAQRGQVFQGETVVTDRTWNLQDTIPDAIIVSRLLYLPLMGRNATFTPAPPQTSASLYLPWVSR